MNLLRAVLESNFEVACVRHEGGWCHGSVPALFRSGDHLAPEWPVAVVAKNPFASLPSMFRYFRSTDFAGVDCGRSWDEFLKGRIVLSDVGHPLMPRQRFGHPIDYWNHVHYSWATLPETTRALVRYEDLLVAPELIATRVANQFDLGRATEQFVTPERVVRDLPDSGIRTPAGDFEERRPFTGRAFHLSEDFIHEYSVEQVRWMSDSLDAEVLQWFGYSDAATRALDRLGASGVDG